MNSFVINHLTEPYIGRLFVCVSVFLCVNKMIGTVRKYDWIGVSVLCARTRSMDDPSGIGSKGKLMTGLSL